MRARSYTSWRPLQRAAGCFSALPEDTLILVLPVRPRACKSNISSFLHGLSQNSLVKHRQQWSHPLKPRHSRLIIHVLGLAFLAACAPKDADIEKAISEKLSDTPNVQVTVHDGVATITGTCDDEIFKKNIEKSVRAVKGVKSVVNTCEIARANQEPAAAAVVINPDTELDKSIHKVVDAYDGVSATVVGGVVTLSGEIKRDKLQPLMQSIQELKPKKVDNKLIIK
jgi:hyperosmotically inducible protein